VAAYPNYISSKQTGNLSDCRMVRFKTAITGIAVIAIGILMLTAIAPYLTVTVQETQRHDVDPRVEFLVGDTIDRSYTLPESVSVIGSINVEEAPSNQSTDIRFSVFDADNYAIWSTGGQANALFSTDGQGQFNYTFTTPKSGLYYFVFDNRASLFKKYVVFSLAYDEAITSQEPDTRVPYVAWALILMGGVISAVGLIRKPVVSWA
jgi:emp24/gp25L/p24 family/GOLD